MAWAFSRRCGRADVARDGVDRRACRVVPVPACRGRRDVGERAPRWCWFSGPGVLRANGRAVERRRRVHRVDWHGAALPADQQATSASCGRLSSSGMGWLPRGNSQRLMQLSVQPEANGTYRADKGQRWDPWVDGLSPPPWRVAGGPGPGPRRTPGGLPLELDGSRVRPGSKQPRQPPAAPLQLHLAPPSHQSIPVCDPIASTNPSLHSTCRPVLMRHPCPS